MIDKVAGTIWEWAPFGGGRAALAFAAGRSNMHWFEIEPLSQEGKSLQGGPNLRSPFCNCRRNRLELHQKRKSLNVGKENHMDAPASVRLAARVIASIGLFVTATGLGVAAAQAPSLAAVRFDVPQVVVAVPVQRAAEVVPPNDAQDLLVSLDLTVSVIVESLSASPIDQLLIEVTPRGGTAMVADYAPRTELASEYTGGIEVQETDEASHALGLALEACYAPFGSGKLNASKGEKNINSTKYNRVAPMHLIAASGTTRRGRGVYFKFRTTEQQIIEGDRQLSLTLRVPNSWRGELLEVAVRGESHPRGFTSGVASLAGMPSKPQLVGAARFLVATYRNDDPQGQQVARRLADTEAEMRRRLQAVGSDTAKPLSSPTALLRHVSYRIDWNQETLQQKAALALHRALDGSLDPHVDRDFKDLPVETRVSCLDYLEARREYLRISQ